MVGNPSYQTYCQGNYYDYTIKYTEICIKTMVLGTIYAHENVCSMCILQHKRIGQRKNKTQNKTTTKKKKKKNGYNGVLTNRFITYSESILHEHFPVLIFPRYSSKQLSTLNSTWVKFSAGIFKYFSYFSQKKGFASSCTCYWRPFA